MKRSTDRILTTHTGSLVRPVEIVEAMRAIALQEPYDAVELERNLKSGVAEVVKQQAASGVDVPSDGEYGKHGWIRYIRERLGGIEVRTGATSASSALAVGRAEYPGFYEVYNQIEQTTWLPRRPGSTEKATPAQAGAWICTGPVTYVGQEALQRDIANFKAALAGVDVQEAFMPVVAPCSAESPGGNEYYPDDESYLNAIADALHEEYQAIVDAGFVLQIDDAILPMRAVGFESIGAFRDWAQLRIAATNRALKGIPEDRVRYHMCWGSQNVPHTWDINLRDIVDLILQVNAQAYSLEAANPRHEHEWQVWEKTKLPDGKILIPGLIMHSTNVVEHPELVAWRIENFARLVGRENVMGGTDCGFCQNWNLARVHPEVQWAKLEALAEGARLASKSLWK